VLSCYISIVVNVCSLTRTSNVIVADCLYVATRYVALLV